MSSVPYIPDNAPFSPEQRAWLNGFLAGMFSRAPAGAGAEASAKPLQPLTILWGSQTGTCEGLAKQASKEAGKRGFAPTVVDMAEIDPGKLAGEKNVLVITSTYGDGEPPDNARLLYDSVRAEGAPSLEGVSFSVCGLGDTNYTQFCQCAKDFDAVFEKLGATRIADRADCDLDYDTPFVTWLEAALDALGSQPATGSGQSNDVEPDGYSRSNPFPAKLLTVHNLSGEGSAKEVNHVEFSLEGSGLEYEVGDALGVYPHNCPELVAEVLAALGCDGEEAVQSPVGTEIPLRRALTEFYDLSKPAPELLESLGVSNDVFHVIDALHATGGVALKPVDFVSKLKRLQPRLYSISSSPRAHPGEVHLTVGAVRYEAEGRSRKGVCSTFLPERGSAIESIPVYVHANKAFKPPADPNIPMIMVGPGTGIAPFRAFLEHRAATGAAGMSWLFFGDQHEAYDFLYRDELAAMKEAGTLDRLDLAWSRDQEAKVYVQDRMLEQAREIWAWLERGAYFYVCGDASRMAKDVDAALHKIIESAGGKTTEGASEYVRKLRAEKRYQRDVY